MRSLAVLVGAWIVLALAPPASAQQRPVTQRLSLALGVPIPLRVYGGDASLDGLDLRFLLRMQLGYELSPARRAPLLTLGARSSLSLVAVSDGELTLWGWAALVGPHVGLRVRMSEQPRSELRAGVGPALARSGFRIDEELHRNFWAPAAYAFAAATVSLGTAYFVAFDLTVEHVRPAPRDKTFFNQRLGSTTLLAISLGVGLDF